LPALDETVAIGVAFVAPVVEEPLPHRGVGAGIDARLRRDSVWESSLRSAGRGCRIV